MIFLTPVIQGIVITRTHWWTFWITLGLMSLSGDTLFRGQCQSEGYSKFALNNSRLKNYVISTHSVRSLEDCALLCLNDTHCSSYNFHISSFLHKCELNSKSRWSAKPGSLMVENGYQHYEMENLTETESFCETVGCQNDGVCHENCETLFFPHMICKCPVLFTGAFCERRKIGNFLLNYNGSTISHHISVALTLQKVKHLAVCVWIKPYSSDGVVFSYATDTNSREMALLFNELNVILHLGGQVIPLNITLPVKIWSHICLVLYDRVKLHIYYSGFIHNLVNVTAAAYGRSRTNRRSTADKVRIKAAGILVPGFDQTTPGEANRSSASNLTLTRLYMMDNSELRTFEVLRLFNEPYFSDLSRKFHFDWRDFYQPNANTSELVSVTEEPDLGNFDIRFPDIPFLAVNISYIAPLDTFVLSMWIRVNTSRGENATIFELDSERGTVLKLTRVGLGYDFEFMLKTYSNSTVKLSCPNVISDHRWFHLLFHWTRKSMKLLQYKHGTRMHSRTNRRLNTTLPEIHNGAIKIGGVAFVGEITCLNLWSVSLSREMIEILALNPGNAAGDLFSWKSLNEEGYSVRKHSPSSCYQRPTHFDLIFPQNNENYPSYISMSSSYTSRIYSITSTFWIKISSSASQFTLISYAVPSEVNEFAVHFDTTGIWVSIHGSQRFFPLSRAMLLEKWHHILIGYSSWTDRLFFYRNGELVIKVRHVGESLIAKDGVLVIGAQQSRYNNVQHSGYLYTGEVSQLQIYRRTFSNGIIHAFSARCSSLPGNFFRWADMPGAVKGKVRVRHQSECLKAKSGEVDW